MGAFAVVKATLRGPSSLSAEHVDMSKITWSGADSPPQSNKILWGAADPRITYRPHNKLYYLTWDNCTFNCYPQRETLLSTTKNPFDLKGWKLHGPVFPWNYTSGASLLFRDTRVDNGEAPPHLAFVCNSN